MRRIVVSAAFFSLTSFIVGCTGQPLVGAPTTGMDGLTGCGGTQIMCGGRCIDPLNNNVNCGTCGHACASGFACIAGACVLNCTGTQIACDSECIDANVDPDHCGSCGNVCATG